MNLVLVGKRLLTFLAISHSRQFSHPKAQSIQPSAPVSVHMFICFLHHPVSSSNMIYFLYFAFYVFVHFSLFLFSWLSWNCTQISYYSLRPICTLIAQLNIQKSRLKFIAVASNSEVYDLKQKKRAFNT